MLREKALLPLTEQPFKTFDRLIETGRPFTFKVRLGSPGFEICRSFHGPVPKIGVLLGVSTQRLPDWHSKMTDYGLYIAMVVQGQR